MAELYVYIVRRVTAVAVTRDFAFIRALAALLHRTSTKAQCVLGAEHI